MEIENPPAFPVSTIDGFTNEGMTLRDYFAGQALSGICAMSDSTGSWSWTEQQAVEQAYSIAKAMLAARKEPT